jgi:hypothetical protein
MRSWGQRAIAVALSIAFIANIPTSARAANNNAAAAVAGVAALLLVGAAAGAAIAHASAPPRRTVVVKKTVVSSRKCHTELIPVLNSKGKQVASQQKQVC